MRVLLEDLELLLKAGTILDATIITAPKSMKHAAQTRDPAVKQTRKGNQWSFGMQVHVRSDTRGIVHTVTTTAAATADIMQLDDVLHGQERVRFGDQACGKQADRPHWEASGGVYRINRRDKRTANRDRIYRTRSRTWCRVERILRVVQRWWGFTTVWYRGLANNTTRVPTTFAVATL